MSYRHDALDNLMSKTAVRGGGSPADDLESSTDLANSADSELHYTLRDLSSGINVEEDEDSDGQDVYTSIAAPKRRAVTRMRGSATKPKASAMVRKVDSINPNVIGYTNEISRSSISQDADSSRSEMGFHSATKREQSLSGSMSSESFDIEQLSDQEEPMTRGRQVGSGDNFNNNKSHGIESIPGLRNANVGHQQHQQRFTAASFSKLGRDGKDNDDDDDDDDGDNNYYGSHRLESRGTNQSPALASKRGLLTTGSNGAPKNVTFQDHANGKASDFVDHEMDEVAIEDVRSLFIKSLVNEHAADKMDLARDLRTQLRAPRLADALLALPGNLTVWSDLLSVSKPFLIRLSGKPDGRNTDNHNHRQSPTSTPDSASSSSVRRGSPMKSTSRDNRHSAIGGMDDSLSSVSAATVHSTLKSPPVTVQVANASMGVKSVTLPSVKYSKPGHAKQSSGGSSSDSDSSGRSSSPESRRTGQGAASHWAGRNNIDDNKHSRLLSSTDSSRHERWYDGVVEKSGGAEGGSGALANLSPTADSVEEFTFSGSDDDSKKNLGTDRDGGTTREKAQHAVGNAKKQLSFGERNDGNRGNDDEDEFNLDSEKSTSMLDIPSLHSTSNNQSVISHIPLVDTSIANGSGKASQAPSSSSWGQIATKAVTINNKPKPSVSATLPSSPFSSSPTSNATAVVEQSVESHSFYLSASSVENLTDTVNSPAVSAATSNTSLKGLSVLELTMTANTNERTTQRDELAWQQRSAFQSVPTESDRHDKLQENQNSTGKSSKEGNLTNNAISSSSESGPHHTSRDSPGLDEKPPAASVDNNPKPAVLSLTISTSGLAPSLSHESENTAPASNESSNRFPNKSAASPTMSRAGLPPKPPLYPSLTATVDFTGSSRLNNAIVGVSVSSRERRSYSLNAFQEQFTPPPLSEFARMSGVILEGWLEKHARYSGIKKKKYYVLAESPTDFCVLKIYRKATSAAWGTVPTELKAVIPISRIDTVKMVSSSKSGRKFEFTTRPAKVVAPNTQRSASLGGGMLSDPNLNPNTAGSSTKPNNAAEHMESGSVCSDNNSLLDDYAATTVTLKAEDPQV